MLTYKSQLVAVVRIGLTIAINLDLEQVNSGDKTLKQHEKDIKDLKFYVNILKDPEKLILVPTRVMKTALEAIGTLAKSYKSL